MTASEHPTTGTTLRLVLADDHNRVREGLRRIIDDQDDMEVIGEAADGRAAVRLVADLRPAILLVDVSMPGMDGVEVTRAVRAESPDAQVIGFTRHREPHVLQAMLDAGAAGYVLKQSPSSHLLQAIRLVAAGTPYIDPVLSPKPGRAVVAPAEPTSDGTADTASDEASRLDPYFARRVGDI